MRRSMRRVLAAVCAVLAFALYYAALADLTRGEAESPGVPPVASSQAG